MPRHKKIRSEINLKPLYAAQPWRCSHFHDRSEVLAYVEASGSWETLAIVQPTAGASAEKLATYMVTMLNEMQQDFDPLRHAFEALELVVNDGLNSVTEKQLTKTVHTMRQVFA